MRKIIARGAAFAAVLVFIAACGSTEETVRDERAGPLEAADAMPLVAAYHPWWTQGAWRAYPPTLYDEVFFFSVEIDSTGRIAKRNGWPDRWYDMQRSLGDAGVRVTPVVTLFDEHAFKELFQSSSSSTALQTTLLDLLRDSPAAGGLQIDFEVYQPVSGSIRTNFTTFVRDMRAQMDRLRSGLHLSVYLVAYDESDVFDEAALAEVADYLVIQGYDLHSRGEDRTGPVAALEGWGRRNWRAIVSRLDDLNVPRSKIVMSVPYYGYEWPAVSDAPGARTTGRGVTVAYTDVDSVHVTEGPPSALERAERYGQRRDTVSGSPYYAYEDTSGWRQGWFEDAVSLAEKYRFVREEGLRGVAIFPPAYGSEELAETLDRAFRGGTAQSGSR